MPTIRNPATQADRGQIGCAAHVKATWDQRAHDGDPKVKFMTDDAAERERLHAILPMTQEAKRKAAAMARGEPMTYPCGYLLAGRSGLKFPEAKDSIRWLADHRQLWVPPLIR
jgi:hypothetical protein